MHGLLHIKTLVRNQPPRSAAGKASSSASVRLQQRLVFTQHIQYIEQDGESVKIGLAGRLQQEKKDELMVVMGSESAAKQTFYDVLKVFKRNDGVVLDLDALDARWTALSPQVDL